MTTSDFLQPDGIDARRQPTAISNNLETIPAMIVTANPEVDQTRVQFSPMAPNRGRNPYDNSPPSPLDLQSSPAAEARRTSSHEPSEPLLSFPHKAPTVVAGEA